MKLPTRFTVDDAQRAYDVWGCNCGPGALAAILGLTLDQVRPHLGDFEAKRYTNPTLMKSALVSLGAKWSLTSLGQRRCGWQVNYLGWPRYGLARIQWEGPWTKPGVPIAARYRHTHWVGSMQGAISDRYGIFDINCLNNGSGWVSADDWRDVLVPWLLSECEPKADGRWHITHAIEIEIA